jgi:hypothetical protein
LDEVYGVATPYLHRHPSENQLDKVIFEKRESIDLSTGATSTKTQPAVLTSRILINLSPNLDASKELVQLIWKYP